MTRNRIIIVVVAVFVIVAFVLFRDPLSLLFGGDGGTSKKIAAAENNYVSAQTEIRNIDSQIEAGSISDEDAKIAISDASTAREEAIQELTDLGLTPQEIEALNVSDEPPLLRVEVVHSQAQIIESGIALSGQAEASRKLDVRAEISGQIISEPIASGTAIVKDQILCELDPGTSQAALDQANAALQTAKTQYASTSSLQKRGLASTAALQNANAALEQAQNGVDNAKKAIERLTIRAPFDGVLENQTAELGELMQPGSVCASIIALDRLVLVGNAPETQVDKIKLGAQAIGTMRDGTELRGQVTFVAATADAVTRTYRVEVSVDNSGDVRDGASVRILIALAGTKGHLIPQNALTLNDAGLTGVMIAQNDIAQFVEAELVRDTADGLWVTGLPEEADVIIEGQEYAVDGQQIEPVFTDGAR